MDKITQYQQSIKKVLQNHTGGSKMTDTDEYSEQVIIDDTNGHYLIMGVGWQKYKRLHGISLHLDLIGDKIYIQQDWTEPGAALELENLGVAKSDIVLAFHAPYRRAMIEEYGTH